MVSHTIMSRFTIRELLWLIIAVAISTGWYIDRRALDAERARHRERAIEKEIALYHLGHALTYPCDQLDFDELQKVVAKAIAK
jgi:hypothetical protein